MQTFLENYKPKRPFATNDYSKGLYQHDRDSALKMRHIETAPKAYRNMITLDLDIPDAARFLQDIIGDEQIATPNFIVENPDTTHAHATWILGIGASGEKPQAFMEDVRKKMTIRAGGDLGYNNRTMRNPLYFPTQQLTDELYTLEFLNSLVKDVKLPKRNTDKRANPDMLAMGRNTATFELLRHFAYANWYAFHETPAAYEAAITEKAHEINCTHESALPPTEINATVKSVIRWVNKNFSIKDFLAIQAARGRKSGNARRQTAQEKFIAVTASMSVGMTMKDACEGLEINYNSFRASFKKYKEMFATGE